MKRQKEPDQFKDSKPGRKSVSKGSKPGSGAGKKQGRSSGKSSPEKSPKTERSGQPERPESGATKGKPKRPSQTGQSGTGGKPKRSTRSEHGSGGEESAGRKPNSRQTEDRTSGSRQPQGRSKNKPFGAGGKNRSDKRNDKRKNRQKGPKEVKQEGNLGGEIRLNKYIAHAGFCSRREADTYIEEGKVWVNGVQVTEHGTKVKHTDDVKVNGQSISLEPFVYILLNKSKDTISTTDDERGRNTVLDAVEDATGYRVYPVGRLDRHTMGLLVLTNDGDLAHRLMHPSHKVQKVYEVTTSVVLTDEQLTELVHGIELEDGPVKPKKVSRDGMDPKKITVTVFEGRNHLIRRIAAYFGADVVKLKRIRYAGLSPEGLRTGRWRYLRPDEVNNLRKLVKLNTLDFNRHIE